MPRTHSLVFLILKLLPMTDTELKAIAADAIIGDRSRPKAG